MYALITLSQPKYFIYHSFCPCVISVPPTPLLPVFIGFWSQFPCLGSSSNLRVLHSQLLVPVSWPSQPQFSPYPTSLSDLSLPRTYRFPFLSSLFPSLAPNPSFLAQPVTIYFLIPTPSSSSLLTTSLQAQALSPSLDRCFVSIYSLPPPYICIRQFSPPGCRGPQRNH